MTDFIEDEQFELNFQIHSRMEYTMDSISSLTGIEQEMIQHYCRLGLLGPKFQETLGDTVYTEENLFELRRIEHYRRLGVNLSALPIIYELLQDVERLADEVRFLRDYKGC